MTLFFFYLIEATSTLGLRPQNTFWTEVEDKLCRSKAIGLHAVEKDTWHGLGYLAGTDITKLAWRNRSKLCKKKLEDDREEPGNHQHRHQEVKPEATIERWQQPNRMCQWFGCQVWQKQNQNGWPSTFGVNRFNLLTNSPASRRQRWPAPKPEEPIPRLRKYAWNEIPSANLPVLEPNFWMKLTQQDDRFSVVILYLTYLKAAILALPVLWLLY